ncbi:hypothetical protein QR97_27040 [Streptomyces sp. PBH53]|nr:hypothetical protein QR97_27040 [Streptomyces sp. PBH53]
MAAELVRGQNHPLSQVRLEIRIPAGVPVLAGATLGDEHGTVRGRPWVAHPGAPAPPGTEVTRQAAADPRLAIDLAALPGGVHRVDVFRALPAGAAGPPRFGAAPAPHITVNGLDGTELASCTVTGLNAETAVVALELYRRQGAWKTPPAGSPTARTRLPTAPCSIRRGVRCCDSLRCPTTTSPIRGSVMPGRTNLRSPRPAVRSFRRCSPRWPGLAPSSGKAALTSQFGSSFTLHFTFPW